MLYQLGALTFDSPGGLNALDLKERFGADYAVKALVGAQPTREAVGIADRSMTITGTIYPFFQSRAGVSTGLDELALLKQMTYSQEPQLLVNGAGQNLGWFYILSVERDDSNLANNGLGRVINYTVSLAESPNAASSGSMLDTIFNLFG